MGVLVQYRDIARNCFPPSWRANAESSAAKPEAKGLALRKMRLRAPRGRRGSYSRTENDRIHFYEGPLTLHVNRSSSIVDQSADHEFFPSTAPRMDSASNAFLASPTSVMIRPTSSRNPLNLISGAGTRERRLHRLAVKVPTHKPHDVHLDHHPVTVRERRTLTHVDHALGPRVVVWIVRQPGEADVDAGRIRQKAAAKTVGSMFAVGAPSASTRDRTRSRLWRASRPRRASRTTAEPRRSSTTRRSNPPFEPPTPTTPRCSSPRVPIAPPSAAEPAASRGRSAIIAATSMEGNAGV